MCNHNSNFISYPATLPRGIIEYIEIPITQTTPPHYRVNDVNSLIHSVIHAYHPDTTTPFKQNPYVDMNLCTRVTPQSLLEINKIEINDKALQLPIPSVTGNLRPSDKIRKDFPPLPYSTENQQFIKKFNFEYSDLTDTEYVNLCNILINNQNCELLKSCLVISFRSVSTDIRSLRFQQRSRLIFYLVAS